MLERGRNDARVLTVRDERAADALNVGVTDVRFPNASGETEKKLESSVETRRGTW